MASKNLYYLRNRAKILAKARARREASGCRTYNSPDKPSIPLPDCRNTITMPKDPNQEIKELKTDPRESELPLVKEISVINSSSLTKIFKVYMMHCKQCFSKIIPIPHFLEWFHKEVKGPNMYQLVDSRQIAQYERSLAVKMAGNKESILKRK